MDVHFYVRKNKAESKQNKKKRNISVSKETIGMTSVKDDREAEGYNGEEEVLRCTICQSVTERIKKVHQGRTT